MTGHDVGKILILCYFSIQLWMIIALLTEDLAAKHDLMFGAKESYTFGPLGLLICITLYLEKQYKKWKIEQSKKWDR
jgi:hypothetical protein